MGLSTRGLDSADAVKFCKSLRLQSELFGKACAVSMYQAPQSAYDLFGKILVIYEVYKIYFGPAFKAREYLITLGFECATHQTTPDFITSMTFSTERIIRPGYKPARTSSEFVAVWQSTLIIAQ
ncbi:ABC transporter asL7 [Arthroderma sp. PD_2]|nr:ABC transporter asL7 [Arthroderma sp. PD_2]